MQAPRKRRLRAKEVCCMEMLKKIFPLSFKFLDSVANLVIGTLIYLVVGILVGIGIALVSIIPIVGWIIGLLGGLVDVYVLAGIVILFLAYFKVLKD